MTQPLTDRERKDLKEWAIEIWDEGERANESDGVLNPAILNLV